MALYYEQKVAKNHAQPSPIPVLYEQRDGLSQAIRLLRLGFGGTSAGSRPSLAG